MTVAVEQEKEMASLDQDGNNVNPSDYSCQVLLERTTLLKQQTINPFQRMLD